MSFHPDVLQLALESKAAELADKLKEAVLTTLRRRGLVVAISGGIDSACTAALGVRALGAQRVYGLLLPERDSSAASTMLGRKLCERLGIAYSLQDIAPILEAAGCYRALCAGTRPAASPPCVVTGKEQAMRLFERSNAEDAQLRAAARAHPTAGRQAAE